MKESQQALLWLSAAYRELAALEKACIDAEIADWLHSDDPRLRFDAIALVVEHRIISALPALESLRGRLEAATDPGAPSERAKVERAMQQLADTYL